MKKTLIALTIALVLALALSGCAKAQAPESKTPDAPQATASVEPTEEAQEDTSETIEPVAAGKRQDGERFEATIMIEGTEETVQYEHVKSDAFGFEMDYDYETFTRVSKANRESFISALDDADDPENYLEVSYDAQDSDTVAAMMTEALSKQYNVVQETVELDNAGTCILLDATEVREGGVTIEYLQKVYIIPAEDGCRIAAEHYTIEAAEGFGTRMDYIVNTLLVIDRHSDRELTDDQALEAAKAYCYENDPELKNLEYDSEHPVTWSIESSNSHEIVVLFKSYTGAETRYYFDRITGASSITEFVPGVTSEEEETGDFLDAWDYLD